MFFFHCNMEGEMAIIIGYVLMSTICGMQNCANDKNVFPSAKDTEY